MIISAYSSEPAYALRGRHIRFGYKVSNLLVVFTLIVVWIYGISGIQATASRRIPHNLSEAQQSLAEHLTPAEINRIEKTKSEHEMIQIIGLPRAIALTNEWRLWANSPLARYFRSLGVTEPHDMVGIVAETYWCKRHGKPFRLPEKIANLRAQYARQEAVTPKARSPRDGARIDWLVSRESPTSNLYLGISQSDGSFWRYDRRNGAGVQPAHPDEAKELAQLVEAGKR